MTTDDEARWVRDHALTARIIKSRGPLDLCACQWGPCGNCHHKIRHDQCAKRNTTPPRESAAGSITGPRGYVLAVMSDALGHQVHAAFYEIGHRHAWICPCHTTGHDGWTEQQAAIAAAEAARPAQLSLF